MKFLRAASWFVALAVLLVTGFLGLYSGASDIRDAGSALQSSVSIAVIVYGVFGVAAAAALVLRKRWSFPLTMVWAVGCVYAASVSSFAYSDPTLSQPETRVGVAAAFLSSLLICAWVALAVRSLVRGVGLPRGAVARDIPPQ